MIAISFSTLAKVTKGQLVAQESQKELSIEKLVTDSRAITANSDLATAFLALKGPNFDGHRFAEQVIEQGCQLLIVDHHLANVEARGVAQLVVKDTRIALGEIAAFVKAQVAPKTVGITGSSGKTTVKEMVAAILARRGKVLATDGNFNNDIGVP